MHQSKIISHTLISLGNAPSLSGFQYIKDCVEVAMLHQERLTDLYKLIAQRHNKTESSVERAIRFSITSTWHKRNKDFANEIFGYVLQDNADFPTNRLYIATIAEWIRCQT